MDIVFLFPPQWNPEAPYLSIPLLAGQLKSKGFSFLVKDLNIEFYNDFLTKEALINAINSANNYLKSHKEQFEYISKKDYDTLTIDEKIICLKYKEISKYLSSYESRTLKVINFVEDAVSIMKTEQFYEPKQLYKAKIIIEHALDIALLPYYPSKMDTNHYYNKILTLSYDDIIYHCSNKSINIFYDYYRNKLKDEYLNETVFGISIVSESQVVGALTLAKYLKERNKNAKVILGGSLITRIYDFFLDKPQFFNEYCDYIIHNDGEIAIVELVNAIKQNLPLENVSNLIYKNDKGRIIKNKSDFAIEVNNIEMPTLDGFDLSKYLSPDIVMLLQLSKGCYWAKCAFCSFSYCKTYKHRSIDSIIQEIKYFRDNYGIKYFRFSDDAIPPAFFKKLATSLIENKLDIKYIAFARMEKEFTIDLLKLIAKSGCVLIQWGLETSSNRLLKLLNKGIENTDKEKLLKDADNAGIANYVFLMYKFPTETFDEAVGTLEFVKKNWTYITGYILSKFCLEKKSILIDNYKDYGITGIQNNEEFLAHCEPDCTQLSFEEDKELIKMYQNSLGKIQDGKIRFLYILLTDYTFLYIIKYGKQYIKNYMI